MELISNMLFWLSNGMLIPDIIFLLFFFIKALLMIGGFYGTYIARTKINVKLNREIGKTGVEEFLDTLPEGNGKSKLLEYLRKIKAAPQDRALREKLLGDYEIAADKELGKSARCSVLWVRSSRWVRRSWDLLRATSARWPTTCRWPSPPP